ncbi:MAG: hypothetical protein NT080_09850 [Spirochaetes bacterium]|nr:hypothetical protein [Spirochaetota bacterium]
MYRDDPDEARLTHVLPHDRWAETDSASGVVHRPTFTRGEPEALRLRLSEKGFRSAMVLALGTQVPGQATGKVEVPGTRSGWTLIGRVPKNVTFKVQAEGYVNFGCRANACIDGAGAGATGWKDRARVVIAVAGVASFTTAQLAAIGTLSHDQLFNKHSKDLVKMAMSGYGTDYDQGGLWVKVVAANSSELLLPVNLWYCWLNIFNPAYGVCFTDRDVLVYGKAHDGGRSPEARSPDQDLRRERRGDRR